MHFYDGSTVLVNAGPAQFIFEGVAVSCREEAICPGSVKNPERAFYFCSPDPGNDAGPLFKSQNDVFNGAFLPGAWINDLSEENPFLPTAQIFV